MPSQLQPPELSVTQHNSLNTVIQLMVRLDIVDNNDWEFSFMWEMWEKNLDLSVQPNRNHKREAREKSMPWLKKNKKKFFQ